MREYDPNKDYKKYKVTYKHIKNGVLDTDYVFAENEFEAWDVPLDIEEYEPIERTNVVIADGL